MIKNNNKKTTETQDTAVSPQVTDLRPVDFSTGSKVVIRVEELWKEYRLGIISHKSLSKDLQSWWARIRGKEDPNSRIDKVNQLSFNSSSNNKSQITNNVDIVDRFWALKSLSFDVKQGEVLGIIGKNGAGKSTLLKILSKVTTPTKGKIKIKGRIASLLEVGTGFHPELTGRENIFLNGAILGMSKMEIRSKFDAIVSFSEVEKFIDTPVKRYSSGMYVRLAFAVAAHLEPEILIVDEVLAVGDLQFQKKCLGKMKDVGKEGRTILFVSHNMAAVENLCETGIMLHNGEQVFQGDAAQTVNAYLNSFFVETNANLEQRTDRQGKGRVRITQLNIEDSTGNRNTPFLIGSELSFQVDYKGQEEVKNPRVIIGIYDYMGTGIIRLDTEITGNILSSIPKVGRIVCTTKEMNLTPGRYLINIALFSNGEMEDYLTSAAFLDITGSDFFNTGKIFSNHDSSLTKVLVKHNWKVSN